MNEVINITLTEPKLSTSNVGDVGTIKLNNLPPLDTSNTPKKSVNFGPGIEMLMNDKRRSSSPKSDIKLSDLESLDANINLNDSINSSTSNISRKTATAAMFGSVPLNNSGPQNITLNVTEKTNGPSVNTAGPALGAATAQNPNNEKTWDGFKKFNEIPVDPTKQIPKTPQLSNDQILREKLSILRKLEALEKKGIQLTKKYNMDSPLAEMQGEYEMIKQEKEKNNSVKFQGKMLMAAVSAIEFLNAKFDPFDVKLDGWGESVSENLDDYDDVFGELHEKYGGKAKMAPELKLLFMLGGSAAMLHMTNTMFKSSMPGMDDIMRQNPELMQQFTQAAVNSMSRENPGFGGFMSGVMGGGHDAPPMQAPASGPPGPPSEMRRRPPQMPQNMRGRPDVGMARGVAHFDDAINMEEKFESVNTKKSVRRPRPEMKGPGDINEILSGLKTKRVNIQKPDNSSTISVEDLKDMKSSNLDIPRKSIRKPRSEKTTISLNL
jgi:hypothetical protein